MAQGAIAGELRELLKAVDGIRAGAPVDSDSLKAFGLSSGAQPYDLSPALAFLYPSFSPIRNRMTRLRVQGKNFEYKAVSNVAA